jgi:hypothetical protein
MDKGSIEHRQGQYITPKETISIFNSEVREIMSSDLTQQYSFVDEAYYREVSKYFKLFYS